MNFHNKINLVTYSSLYHTLYQLPNCILHIQYLGSFTLMFSISSFSSLSLSHHLHTFNISFFSLLYSLFSSLSFFILIPSFSLLFIHSFSSLFITIPLTLTFIFLHSLTTLSFFSLTSYLHSLHSTYLSSFFLSILSY